MIKEIQELLAERQELRPYLLKVARYAAGSGRMPQRMVLGKAIDDAGATLRLLNRLLAGRCLLEGGRYILKLPEKLRPVSQWQPLVAATGYRRPRMAPDPAADLAAATVKRLHLLYPDAGTLIEQLERSGLPRSFIGADERRAQTFLRLFAAHERLAQGSATTLSQLGSEIFNDSKALRSGAQLRCLEQILRLAHDLPEVSSTELHARCGIIGNPYTSCVTIFAPFAFTTKAGRSFSYPYELFAAGQAAVLPWESVASIDSIQLAQPLRLVTSENAAPFLDLVRAGTPALYTEGYPNGAVLLMLRLLAAAGATAVHAGDSDLDGYRIAEIVGQAIRLEHLLPVEGLAAFPHKPLTRNQTQRLERFMASHPDFPFLAQLRHTLEHGWVEQETFHIPRGKMR